MTESQSLTEGPLRRVVLTVSRGTLTDSTFNTDEVKVVSNAGKLSDPFALIVFVSTDKGFAEWNMADVDLSASTQWIIKGRSAPQASKGGGDNLDRWCP